MKSAWRLLVLSALLTVLAACGSGDLTDTPSETTLETTAIARLNNGVPKYNLSGAANSQKYFTLSVPAGASNLKFTISGGSGDADLFVKFGSKPTTSSYNCRPYNTTNNETCTFTAPRAGTYYVMLRGYRSYSGVKLVGKYQSQSGIRGQLSSPRNLAGTFVAACYYDDCNDSWSEVIEVYSNTTSLAYRLPTRSGGPYTVFAVQDTNYNGEFDVGDYYAFYSYEVYSPASGINLRMTRYSVSSTLIAPFSLRSLDSKVK